MPKPGWRVIGEADTAHWFRGDWTLCQEWCPEYKQLLRDGECRCPVCLTRLLKGRAVTGFFRGLIAFLMVLGGFGCMAVGFWMAHLHDNGNYAVGGGILGLIILSGASSVVWQK